MNRTLADPKAGGTRLVSGLKVALSAFVVVFTTAAVSGCGAVGAALEEGNAPTSTNTTPVYAADMYLSYLEPDHISVGPDPSGSLSLSDGDMTWAQSVQSMIADAISNRLPPLPADDSAWSRGAPGVAALDLLYMPIASISGQWNGEGSSVQVTIPAIPRLEPEPQPGQEDDVPGRNGKGQAWKAARQAYIDAYNIAAAKVEAASAHIANFPLDSQSSDVYGSVNRLASRMGGAGTIVIFSDLLDTQGNATPPDLSAVNVIAVQACTATVSECDAGKAAFIQFVTTGGSQMPKITGHEAAHDIIANLLAYGG